ncbi:type III-B CRISPR module RAMP protein Cmr4 [Tepidimonas charontis]|uniref:CRISPR type III-B/RAMP module RAMP protein Cmr4 n=1 Tax=Tepidimonas charontis TaxID=2267262 RepID=A0A554X3I3_9BURK|nr:type III-B CRISPR module RAMP protein Cmr4 [Tepidimonas charontis]TSE30397.1 CRISPR type III-B/RAMP module RAMP protein Cmr4 [Tepidimonas charontis]
MFEKTRLLFLYAVSPVHMGAGQAIGVIDNPIQRERHTDHPMIAGSGLKGALRHHLEGKWNKAEVARLFGPESNASDYAGCVSFGDAQLVAFPVRSLKRGFVWAVSPVTLARLKRLAVLAGCQIDWSVPQPDAEQALVADAGVLNQSRLVLEAFDFAAKESEALKTIAKWLADNALPTGPAHQHFRSKLGNDFVLLPEEAFSHFVRNATVVEPHVRIDDETGTADEGGLFYTENLPSESLLVSTVLASAERSPKDKRNGEPMSADEVMRILVAGNGKPGLDGALIQVGGDATTGRGQVVLRFAPETKEG